jgi:excisionase family DNA binding protein
MLSVAELAQLLNVNAATIRAHATELGGVRIGRQWRFPPDSPAPTLQSSARGTHPTGGRLR